MLQRSLLGDPFCRFPIADPRIVQPGRHQQIGILLFSATLS